MSKEQLYSGIRKQFDDLLRRIPKDANILFFPVRLETHFRKSLQKNENYPKQLCVRIFPDEICLNQKGVMTEQELEDGKFFWMQWFIASGCKKREREAWDILCDAYPTYRAAWICRELRPKNLHQYAEDGTLFYRRPYPHMEEIEADIISMYDALAKLIPTEETFANSKENITDSKETLFEKGIRTHIFKVKECLYNIDKNVSHSEWIVDYLYDEIVKAIQYVKQRLDSILLTYQTNPKLTKARQMELWDVDFTIVKNFANDVEAIYQNIANKRITLDKLVELYYNNGKTAGFFPSPLPKTVPNDYGWLPTTSNVLPSRFFFIGEVSNSEQVFAVGNPVDRNLELGLSPHTKGEQGKDPYWIDESGNLNVAGGLSWMIDYDVAEKKGMAITVPLPGHISQFNYVYVLGVYESSHSRMELKDLFDSHNYIANSLKFVEPGTPTNLVEGGLSRIEENEDDIRSRRLDLEVYEAALQQIKPDPKFGIRMNDANLLARALGLDYANSFGKLINYDKYDWIKTRNAYRVLWNHFTRYWNEPDSKSDLDETLKKRLRDNLDFIGDFVVNHVRAQGHFPALLLNDVPYGILATTDFKKLSKWIDSYADPRIAALYHDLVQLGNVWKKLRKDRSFDELKYGYSTQQKYLKMAGRTPYSITFLLHMMVSSSIFPDVKISEKFQSDILKQLDGCNYPDPVAITEMEWDATSRKNVPSWLNNEDLNTIEDLKQLIDGLSDTYSDIEKDRIIGGFLDIFTYRIDAWFDGLLHYILCEHALRGQKLQNNKYLYVLNSKNVSPIVTDLRVGAYGWVFDLSENTRKPVDAKTRDQIERDMKLPAKNNGQPIYYHTGEDQAEYIVAPSLQHAITAAILRSGYLRTRKNQGDGYLCVNLSSTRARQALRMVDGIKSGLPTGVVLGADLERYLHDAHAYYGNQYEMDRFIYPLRRLFPQTVDIQSEDQRSSIYTMEVVNGEALLNTFLHKWNYEGSIYDWLVEHGKKELDWVDQMWTLMNHRDEYLFMLFRLIERMYDSYDALNDLLLSEGVHRLVLNDEASYYAICDFMTKGKGNLPEPEILNSPMENVVISHKAVIAMPTKLAPSYRQDKNIMGNVEPTLSYWLSSLLGSMNTIYFYVSYEEGDYEMCSLADMGVEPLEYLQLYSNTEQFARFLELAWRLKNQQWNGNVRIELGNPYNNGLGETDKDILNVYENVWRMDQIKKLLKYSHSIQASELKANGYYKAEDEEFVDLNELIGRYRFAWNKMNRISSEINGFLMSVKEEVNVPVDEANADAPTEVLRPLTDMEIHTVYRLLHQAATAGLTIALSAYKNNVYLEAVDHIKEPTLHDEVIQNQEQLILHLQNVGKELAKRIATATEAVAGSKEKLSVECYVDAMKALFGPTFKVLTHFKDEYANSDQLFNWHAADSFENVDEDKMDDWLSEVAEVREGMKNWNNLQMFQISVGGEIGTVSIKQMTVTGTKQVDKNDWWLGLEVDKEDRLCDVDSLVCYDTCSKPGPRSYLVFDSWLEYIPYKKHDAGIVFHCDRPDNEAPQTILLAVHSDYMNRNAGTWNLENLEEVLASTRFMMMNRSVSPDDIYKNYGGLSALFPLLRNGNDQFYRRDGKEFHSSGAPKWMCMPGFTILDSLLGGDALNTDED